MKPSSFKQAHRRWLRTPGAFCASVVCLGVGLGVATAIFAVVDHVLLRPLPYPDSDRLVLIDRMSPQGFPIPVSLEDFRFWHGDLRTVEELAAVKRWPQMPLSSASEVGFVRGALVSESFFRILGCRTLQGSLSNEVDVNDLHAVVSGAYWRRELSGEPIGSVSLTLQGRIASVIAVLSDECRAPEALVSPNTDAFLIVSSGVSPEGMDVGYSLIGRLEQEASTEAVAGELATLARPLPFGTSYPGWHWRVDSLLSRTIGDSRGAAIALLSAIVLMLAATVAAAAGFLLVRSLHRQKDMAIRAAMGAPFRDLAGLAVVDALYVAAWSAIAALGLSLLLVAAVERTIPASVPRAGQIGVDFRVVVFCFLASLTVSLAACLVPVLRVKQDCIKNLIGHPTASARMGSDVFGSALHKGLASIQVAVAFMLVAGGVILGRNFLDLNRIELGFRTQDVYAAFIYLDGRYNDDGFQLASLERLLQSLRSQPGVESAAFINMLPLGPLHGSSGMTMDGVPGFDPGEVLETSEITISDGYFETARIPFLQGRDFRESGNGERECIVNQVLAQRLWGSNQALGRAIPKIGCEVIGVVPNVRRANIREAAVNEIYYPYDGRGYFSYVDVVLRSKASLDQVSQQVASTLHSVDPQLRSQPVRSWTHDLWRQTEKERFYAWIVNVFALAAVLQASAALVALVSSMVKRGKREIGIRMALGADSVSAAISIAGPILSFCGAGLLLGICSYYALSRFLQSLLYRLSPTDFGVMTVAAALISAICLTACWVPARQAARVDPVQTLRQE